MKTKCVLLTIGLGMLLPAALFAQDDCGPAYAAKDSAYVRNVFGVVAPIIERLHELAVQSNEYDLRPQTQRAAMNSEYQALLKEITNQGNGPHNIRMSTANFLNRVVDPKFLGLTGTLVDGSDRETAIANAYDAMRAVLKAAQTMWGCI